MSLLKTNAADNHSKQTRAKIVYKGQKIIKTIKDKIISDTRNIFEQEEVDKFYSDKFTVYKSRRSKNKSL